MPQNAPRGAPPGVIRVARALGEEHRGDGLTAEGCDLPAVDPDAHRRAAREAAAVGRRSSAWHRRVQPSLFDEINLAEISDGHFSYRRMSERIAEEARWMAVLHGLRRGARAVGQLGGGGARPP
jgi:hypothetical protein